MSHGAADPATRPLAPKPRAWFCMRHVAVTVRGLVVTDNPKNPPGEVGRLYPWLRVTLHPRERRLLALDEHGRVERDPHTGRRVALVPSGREVRPALRAPFAAVRRAWRLGSLDLPLHTAGLKPTGSIVATLIGSLLGLGLSGVPALMAVQGWQARHAFPPQQQWWLLWLAIGAVACAALSVVAIGRALALALRGRSRPEWTAVARLTSTGAVVRRPDGSTAEQPWTALRAVERAPTGMCHPALVFSDGTCASVPPDPRAPWVIESACKQHLGHADVYFGLFQRSARRAGLIVLVLCLAVLPAALSGPFSAGNLPLTWPLSQSLVLAAFVAFFPDVGRFQAAVTVALTRWLEKRLQRPRPPSPPSAPHGVLTS